MNKDHENNLSLQDFFSGPLDGHICKTEKRLKLVLNHPSKEFKQWLRSVHPKLEVDCLDHFHNAQGEGTELLPIPDIKNPEVVYKISIEGFYIVNYLIIDSGVTEVANRSEFKQKNKVIIMLHRVTKKSNQGNNFNPFSDTNLNKHFHTLGVFKNPTTDGNEICISARKVLRKNFQRIINGSDHAIIKVKKDQILF